MTETMESRIIKLEVKSANHEDDIRELRETTLDMKKTMHSIEKNIGQIKYISLGALGVILTQSVGIDKAVKLLMGI